MMSGRASSPSIDAEISEPGQEESTDDTEEDFDEEEDETPGQM